MNLSKTTTERTSTSVEISYVLIGEFKNGILHAKLSWRQSGSPVSVAFDWNRVMAREEAAADIVGFYHTHPKGFENPSDRDVKTMFSWSFCFGKPLVCAIASGPTVRAWIFDDADSTTRECEYIELFKQNWLVGVW